MNDHRILYGDVQASLFTLEDNSIDSVITSPPYWSQRDYGFDGQIGNESTKEEYLAKLISIFNLMQRKLKPEGNFYLNIGDKYVSRYGNTPLAMIPYLLAYYLVTDGWNLVDTIIWYKPNHMPAPVKNRFTNTYEPIFVFSRNKKNYYSEYNQKVSISNILKIPLQPVPYKHMATYPEKLVETLLGFGLPNDALVLDPFAGSGTTCKAVQKISEGYFNPIKMRSIMIEAYKYYVKIIKQRCQIKRKDIRKLSFQPYHIHPLADNFVIPEVEKKIPDETNIEPDNVIIKVFQEPANFHSFFPLLFSDSLANILDDDGVLFLGLPNHDIKEIFSIAQLNNHGWVIRNMIVVPRGHDWIPIFMLVKDIKSVQYKFNLDNIRVAHQFEITENWEEVDFIGYRVEKAPVLYKNADTGLIGKVLSHHPNGLPHWVVVKWKSGKYSLEEVINTSGKVNTIKLYCPACEAELKKFHHYKESVSCPSCSLGLWQDMNSIPKLLEVNPCVKPEYLHNEFMIKEKDTRKDYEGKFKDVERQNIGQSPGARVSVEEQFFTVKRYYNVKQSMISDYLNLHRINNGFTKNELTKKYPPEYKHTVGHWLRKDMGGSLPKYEDLMKLDELLHLDQSYINYISRTGLKLQTVMADTKGKNPGDFLDLPLPKVINMLKQVGE
ncbi:MAG: site-specific DNA-methyltransferase [Candidatus Heimdallarchaeota archaeon]|nr:MAG: site-specific DNA-methyltransferase [Candidatus Heimdallarchaeota archaeon]